ncbi:MAG: hypothetical protein KDD89_11230, partial [Anaerolineales bacterium]|nr:hypothetical protein [Anaerolineales bacterium]
APTVQLDPTPSTPITATRLAENLWQLSFSGQVTDPAIGANSGSGVAQVEVRLSPNGTGWHTAVLTGTNWHINYTLAQLTSVFFNDTATTDIYTVEVRALDNVGNRTPLPDTVTRTLLVDNRAPQSTLAHPAPAALVAEGTTFTITNRATTPVLASQPVISGTTTETGNAQAGIASQEIRLIPADTGVAPGIWLGRYYNDPSFVGAPTLTRADETLRFDWGADTPDPRITNSAFGVRWNRDTLFRVHGRYTFTVTHNTGSRVQLFVDNINLLDTNSAPTNTITLDAGLHKLDVQYTTDGTTPAAVQLEIQLDAPQFTPTTLAASGAGVSSSSWRYGLPAVTEGIYQIDLRATDVLGNRNDNLSTYNNWRGEIDTASPRITLDLEYTGQGNSAQTTYRLLVQDFNLSEDGLTLPCEIRPENRYVYDSDWYADWFSGDNRLYQIYTTCSVPGHERTLPPITACDTYGQCTDYTNPNLPQPPNDSFLFWADGNALNRLDLTTLDSAVIATGPTLSQVELDSNHGRVFWTTATGSQSQIRRAELDGTSQTTIYSENTAVPLRNLLLNNQLSQLTYTAPDGFMHVTRSLDGAWLAASSIATDIIHPATGETKAIHTGESTFNPRWTLIDGANYSTSDLVRYNRITRWGFPYGPGYRLGDHVPA